MWKKIWYYLLLNHSKYLEKSWKVYRFPDFWIVANEFIDYIVVFDEDTPLEVIKLIRPDVLVKGADYKDKYVVGTNEIKEYGGELVLVDLVEGRSTTNVIEKLKGE